MTEQELEIYFKRNKSDWFTIDEFFVDVLRKTLLVVFLFVLQFSNAQHTLFKELFSEFDAFNQQGVEKVLNTIDESLIPHQTKSDSILFSLYSIIKFNSKEKDLLKSDGILESKYRQNLNFLLDNNWDDYLPYFLNHYAATYGFDKKYFSNSMTFLNKSIEIEKKGLNKSHLLSIDNLFNSLDYKDIMRSVYDDEYKSEDLMQLIQHYEKNKTEFNFITHEFLFKKYYKAAEKEIISDSLRFTYFEKTFEHAKKIESLPEFHSYRNFLFTLRRLSDKINDFNTLSFINKNYNHLFSKTDYFINECYINEYDASSFYAIEQYVKERLKENYQFNRDEILDLTLVLSEISIKFQKELLNIEITTDVTLIESIFKINYDFLLVYGDISQRLSSINNIINFLQNYNIENSVFDLLKLKNENHELIYNIIVNNLNFNLSPYRFIDFYKYREANVYYPNWTEEEIGADQLMLFNNYKKTLSYEDIVTTLQLYWNYSSSISDFALTKGDTKSELNLIITFIKNELNETISDTDIELRISLSNIDEISKFNQKIIDFRKKNIINEDRFIKLKSILLLKKANLINSKEANFEFYKHFIDNINTNNLNHLVTTAMATAINFKLQYGLVELSNHLLNIYNEDFKNRTNLDKYLFEMTAGLYYKYLNRLNDALWFFLSARANPAHWDSEIIDYASITRDNSFCFEIFDIYIKKNELNKANEYYNDYLESYDDIIQAFSENKSKIVQIDLSTFYELERKALDMKRRLFFMESKHEESEKIIDQMIAFEDDKPYFGKFNLSMLKFRSQISQNKNSDEIFLIKLDSIYTQYKAPIDNQYYLLQKQLGVVSKEMLVSASAKFESELKKIDLINNLSYESQINLMLDIGNKMAQLERYFFKVDDNLHLTEKLADFKLKVDNMDRYNTSLLNMDELDTQKYFELLNNRFTEKDYNKLMIVKNEFDVFQQQKKISSNQLGKIELSDFQSKLKPNQAYVRFSKLNNQEYFAYLIGKDFIKIISLGKSDLTKTVDYYTSRMTQKLDDVYSYNILFKPILSSLPSSIDELFIKNEGVYNNINIEALWDSDNKIYLFDKYKINYIERPSAIFKTNVLSNFKTAFLFGNPDFSNGGELIASDNTIVRSGINPLPYTEKEVNTLNTILKNNGIKTITTNLETSTEEAIYQNSKSNIIHIATHGFFIEGKETDRFNWGLLATISSKTVQSDLKKEYRNDGIVFGGEIILKDFTKADLVVLSACETGYGTSTFFGGENLANTFLRAGAKNIISTLWPIDDAITMEFMIIFYSELMKSKIINLSLRKAKQAIKDRYPYPNYWGPFILIQNKM